MRNTAVGNYLFLAINKKKILKNNKRENTVWGREGYLTGSSPSAALDNEVRGRIGLNHPLP